MSATFDPRQYLADFVIEAGEHLATFDELLAHAERQLLAGRALEEGLIHRLFRAVHTLKGMAGMLGFSAIVTLSHETESILDAVRAGKRHLDVAEIGVLVDVADGLGRLLEQVSHSGKEDGVDVFPLQTALLALARGELALPQITDLLERLDPHEQMSILVDVAKGEQLFNLTYSGDDFAAAALRIAVRGRVLGAWDESGQLLGASSKGPALPVMVLLLAPPGTTADEVRFASGPGVAAVSEAPLPWLTAQVPVASEHAEVTPAEAACKAAAVAPPSPPPAVRVEAARLDKLALMALGLEQETNRLAALVATVAELPGAQGLAAQLASAVAAAQQRTLELQEELQAARRVPAGTLFSRFVRPLRELARACGKSVRLEPLGGDILLDKDAGERLIEPLMHLLRNAVDHGIEGPNERQASGKPLQGVIVLSATIEGNELALAIGDDGRGIDHAAVLAKARTAGIVAPDQLLDTAAIERLIFAPGLSTAIAVGNVSGRGVGMDAVNASVERLGGRTEISSQPGRGTRFVLRLPLTDQTS
jgi:two-component system chemotaxis sensor kinase CheA